MNPLRLLVRSQLALSLLVVTQTYTSHHPSAFSTASRRGGNVDIRISPAATAQSEPITMETQQPPQIGKRILATDDPCIVKMQKMMRGKEGVLSLAQGIVHWSPPEQVMEAARSAIEESDTHSYCADDGLIALRDALQDKIKTENGLTNSAVMVTSGSNQAYTNVVLSLLDENDVAVVFRPYYFNHLMALQMVGADVHVASVKDDLALDLEALERRLQSTSEARVKLVTVSNPGNPTGVMIPADTLRELAQLCKASGSWLVVDNAYDYFAYPREGHAPHSCVEGPHIINTFSFSKSYGMMGWRVGYLAYPAGSSPPFDVDAICLAWTLDGPQARASRGGPAAAQGPGHHPHLSARHVAKGGLGRAQGWSRLGGGQGGLTG